MSIIKSTIAKFSQKFKIINKEHDLSKINLNDANFPYSNINKKNEIIYHDLDFMKYILLNNNGSLQDSYSLDERENINKLINSNVKIITIILNNTLDKYAEKIIPFSDILICADGGANRLYDLLSKLENEKNEENNKREIEINKKENVQSNDMEKLSRKSMSNLDINTKEDKIILENKIDKKNDNKNLKLEEVSIDNNLLKDKIFNLFKVATKRDENFLNFPPKTLPDLICGDFDSIMPHVYNFYKSKSVIFERSKDQTYNDLDKCINKIKDYISENDKIIILGATGNRFDQTCANISSLYKNISINNVYLIGENNLLFLLKQCNNIININLKIFEKTCGIIPIGKKCKVKTEGLKYNLNHEYLSFDTLISSSNEIDQTSIKIYSDSPVLWYSQLKDI